MGDISYDVKKQLQELSAFKGSERELKQEYLDPDHEKWRDDPCTQGQIRMVYVLLKELGYSKEEKEIFEMETDFHHMTKGEIKDLIDELKLEVGWGLEDDNSWKKGSKRKNNKNNKANNKKDSFFEPVHKPNKYGFVDISDDDIPF